MKTFVALATILFALPLAAEDAHVLPLAPTTATPIEVHYVSSCHPSGHAVARDGSEITITALDPQCPNVLAIPHVEKVKLSGLLPIGVYSVRIRNEDQPIFTSFAFAVRYAGPTPFELHPSSMEQGDGRPVRMSGVACESADCSGVTVQVDGEPVAFTTADGAIWFTAPDLVYGLVDVTVQKSGVVMTSPGALYYSPYFDHRRDHSAWEPILFPVLFYGYGAHGSRWSSEATVSNPAPWPVEAIYTLHGIGPCVMPCDPAFEPKSFEKFGNGAYPHGTVMWAPRSEAGHLALSIRIRDLSRQAEGFGTEIPVVRERDFIHGSNIRLLDVPLDPRYRVKVRLYMIEPVLAPSGGGMLRVRRAGEVLQMPFTLTRREGVYAREPYYAEVDLPQGVAGERANVEIEMPLEAFGWAFASITNNETQQVTIVTPQ